MDVLALPRASTRCYRLYILVLKLYYKGGAQETHFSELSGILSLMKRAPERVSSRSRAFIQTIKLSGWNRIDDIIFFELMLTPRWRNCLVVYKQILSAVLKLWFFNKVFLTSGTAVA
jgi:hypothetical protein